MIVSIRQHKVLQQLPPFLIDDSLKNFIEYCYMLDVFVPGHICLQSFTPCVTHLTITSSELNDIYLQYYMSYVYAVLKCKTYNISNMPILYRLLIKFIYHVVDGPATVHLPTQIVSFKNERK